MKRILMMCMAGAMLASPCFSKDDLVRSHVGICHVNGKYHFTDKPFLVEGGDAIQAIGSKAIKVWLTPEDHDLLKLIQTEPYQQLFAMPFEVYALETQRYSYLDFRKITPEDLKAEEVALYDLTKYLLEKYQGSGKTFILQNWEGDYYLHSSMDLSGQVSGETFQKVALWFNARQDGVDRARKEKVYKDVNVYHAAEANHIITNMQGQPCLVNDVFPNTHCDLYSYSCYETQYDPRAIVAALRYLRSKAPDSTAFGDYNVMLGEFGWAENKTPAPEICAKMEDVIAVVVREKIPYAFYWQLYCNEWAKGEVKSPTAQDLKGFWLIRPDRSIAPMYETLKSLMNEPFRDGPRFKYAYEREASKKPTQAFKTPKLEKAPTVDGDLSDWKEKAVKVSVGDKAKVFEIKDWTPADCSAEIFVAATADALVIGADVTDDIQLQNESRGNIWKSDGIQISVDGDNDKVPFYDANDSELGFGLAQDGKPLVWVWHPTLKITEMTAFQVSVVRKDTHTIYEIVIPFTALRATQPLGAGKSIGLNFVINDDDGQSRGWVEWEDGIARTKNPANYPTFTLAP
jgi:cellulose/xylan binding protein with CBM9 domain